MWLEFGSNLMLEFGSNLMLGIFDARHRCSVDAQSMLSRFCAQILIH